MALVSQSEFQLRKRLTHGDNGGKVTNPRQENEEKWREETNKVIVQNLVENIESLLGGKAKYVTVIDKKSSHKRIVIDYDFSSNLQ